MNAAKRMISLAAVVLSLCSWVSAHNYYVSLNGNDSNDGSREKPLRKVQTAVNKAQPGDSVLVEAGNYGDNVWISRSGSSGKYIVIKSTTRHGAKLGSTSQDRHAFGMESVSFIEIHGFDLTAGKNTSGIDALKCHHMRFINNAIHDAGASGIQANGGDYWHIEGNIIYKCSFYMGYCGSGISLYGARPYGEDNGFHNVIRANILYANDNYTGPITDGNGLIIDDFHNSQGYHKHDWIGKPYPYKTLVESNLAFNNGGKGLHVFDSDNVTMRNNTAYLNNTRCKDNQTWRGEITAVKASNCHYYNNIAITSSNICSHNRALLLGLAKTNVTWLNNITYDIAKPGDVSIKYDNSTSGMPSATNGNLLGIDPKFVTASTDNAKANFRLQSQSPGVNAGNNANAAPTDLVGNKIGADGKADIGCYEYRSGSTATEAAALQKLNTHDKLRCTFSNGRLSVHVPFEESLTLFVLDMNGRMASMQQISSRHVELDASRFTAGSYLVVAQGNGEIFRHIVTIK